MRDVAVIGGGLVGLATARALGGAARLDVVVLEAEPRVAAHQSGRNSGVVHSGLYYRPGSLKANNCVAGREALYRYCRERGIAHERCGKVVVAVNEAERAPLAELERRGQANGLAGMRRLDAAGLREREPHVRGLAGLWVPETGIVDFPAVAASLVGDIAAAGGEVLTEARVLAVRRNGAGFHLRTSRGDVEARWIVNCAGLQSDRIARMCGLTPDVRIVPFRGEYYRLAREGEHFVRNLIYPVPDSRFPFLGVHFTRMIAGGVEAGPNAVLALRREGYTRSSFSGRDAWATFTWPGFWRLAGRYWRTGLGEFGRSWLKPAFVRALQRLVPEIRSHDLVPYKAGVRAQAVAVDGSLVDDFRILEGERMLHVLNAPSPAATASLAIGEHLASRATRALALPAS